jgi:hypothetical protein
MRLLNDDFVRRVLGPTLIAMFLGLALPVILIAFVFCQTWLFTEAESTTTLRIINLFSWFHGLPSAVGLVQALPAVATAICLAPGQTRLTGVGRVVFVIAICILVVAFILIVLINPEAEDQSENISGGSKTLEQFLGAANYSLNTAIVYLGLLTGLSLKAQG